MISTSHVLFAQWVDDVAIWYTGMQITETRLGPQSIRHEEELYRHNLGLTFGVGARTYGFVVQKAVRGDGASSGENETGIMLTSGHNQILSNHFRLEIFGRVGVSQTNAGQSLYSADTDLRINLVAFHPDGWGPIDFQSVFPSGYAGIIANKYGRVQGIVGVGSWWNECGVYVTGFHAFNGVNDPNNPGRDTDITYANLSNSGFSAEFTYHFLNFNIGLKKNFPIKNAGNDITLTLQQRLFFQ